MAHPPPDPSAAIHVPGYVVTGLLAQGGMADLYLARRQPPDGERVVIKLLRADLRGDRSYVEMFLQEQRLVAVLRHPNIVRVHEVISTPGNEALVMEFLDGRNLLQVARTCYKRHGSPPPALVAYALCEVLEGLHHAHTLRGAHGEELNLVHRDVSPDNVLFTFTGAVKLLDFGIAKALNAPDGTRTGVIKGKLGYMAPEAVRGERVDARADLFAVGVTLYELLTRSDPFGAEGELEVLRAVCLRDPPAPADLDSTVPPALSEVCMRALRKDRRERYQSAREMQDALRAHLRSCGASLGRGHLVAFMDLLFPSHVRRQMAGARVIALTEPAPEPGDWDGVPATEVSAPPVFDAPLGVPVTTVEQPPTRVLRPAGTTPDVPLPSSWEPPTPGACVSWAALTGGPSAAVLPKRAPSSDASGETTRREGPPVAPERVLSDRWIFPLPPDVVEAPADPTEDPQQAEMKLLVKALMERAPVAEVRPQRAGTLPPSRIVRAPLPAGGGDDETLDEDHVTGMANCAELYAPPARAPAAPRPSDAREPAPLWVPPAAARPQRGPPSPWIPAPVVAQPRRPRRGVLWVAALFVAAVALGWAVVERLG